MQEEVQAYFIIYCELLNNLIEDIQLILMFKSDKI